MAKKAKRAKKTKKFAKRLPKKVKSRTTKKSSRVAKPKMSSRTATKSTGWGVIGTVPILGWILAILAKKHDKYAMYYARQGLSLGLWVIALDFVLTALVVTFPLTFIVNIGGFVLWIVSVVNATSGKMKPTPWSGKLAEKLKF